MNIDEGLAYHGRNRDTLDILAFQDRDLPP